MKDFFSILFSYIKKKIHVLIAFLICAFIFAVVFSLYDLPIEAVAYAVQLSFFALVIIASLRFFSYYKKHKELEHLKNVITVSLPKFPEINEKIEKDYQELLSLLFYASKKYIKMHPKSA